VIKPNGDLFWTGFQPGLFPKHPPKLDLGDLASHLLPDLFDRGPFAVDFLAHLVPVYLLLPTAVLTAELRHRLSILPYRRESLSTRAILRIECPCADMILL
jgi:hypothetical protein